MRKLLILCLAIVLAANALAEAEIDEPVLASEIDATITKSGTVSAVGGSLTYVELNISAPQKRNWQFPEYPARTFNDTEGNTFSVIQNDSPQNPFVYSISTHVITRARVTKNLPNSYSIPDEYSIYLSHSPGIASDNQNIAAMARAITENSSSEFEKAARLAIWVYENVEYDDSLSGKEKDSEWVFRNRRGVCAEYTSLFIAMTRAAGIPARYVTGYSYTESNGWMGHAWAEVYLGEWVPVDPTWMEAGHLDATHIHVLSSASRKADSNVFVYMTPGSTLVWEGSGTTGSRVSEVNLGKVDSDAPSEDYELKVASGNLQFGGETVAYVKMQSDDYRVVDLNLVSCVGAGALVVDHPEKFAILEPGEEKVIPWLIRAPSHLSSGYTYKCPMVLNSQYLAESSVSVTMLPSMPSMEFNAWLEQDSVNIGQEQTLYISSPSHPSGAKLFVLADGKLSTHDASATVTRIMLPASSLGRKDVLVSSNFGGVKRVHYDVVGSESLSIGNLSFSRGTIEGGNMSVSFRVLSNSSVARTARVSLVYGDEERSRFTTISVSEDFTFSFSDIPPGTAVVTARVESQGDYAQRTGTVEVVEKPRVSVQTQFSKGEGLTNVTFSCSKNGNPINVAIYIDGSVAPLSGGSGTVAIEPGLHQMETVWHDIYGNEYRMEQELVVPRRRSTLFRAAGQPPCITFAIPILVLLFIAARR